MALDTRELFARLIQCEAGGEGTAGMQAVATVIMNRATADEGEFSRVNNGGDIRAVITQPGQFVCMRETVSLTGRWTEAGWRVSMMHCFSSIRTAVSALHIFRRE